MYHEQDRSKIKGYSSLTPEKMSKLKKMIEDRKNKQKNDQRKS